MIFFLSWGKGKRKFIGIEIKIEKHKLVRKKSESFRNKMLTKLTKVDQIDQKYLNCIHLIKLSNDMSISNDQKKELKFDGN